MALPRTSSGKPLDKVSAVRLGILIGCCATIALAAIFLPLGKILFAFIETARALGPRGPLLLAVVYVPACLFFVPGMILALTAGYLFGFTIGTVAVSVGSTLGATAAFLAGRTLGRDLVEAGISGNAKYKNIDRIIAERGFRFVLMLRLSPLFPFNVLNYLFGLSGISLGDYVIGSWLGMIPATVMYVYLGTMLKGFAEVGGEGFQGGSSQTFLLIGGLAAIIVTTVLAIRMTGKIIREASAAS